MAKKIDCTRSENRPIASARTSDSAEAATSPSASAPQPCAHPVKRKADAIGADAEEHHVGEGHNARIAEKQVVGGDEQDHHAGLGRDVERLGAGKQERRQGQRGDDEDQQDLQRPAARRIAREQAHRPLTG